MSQPNRSHVLLAISILGWYVSGTLLVSSNKVLLDVLNIDMPLFLTFLIFAINALILAIARARFPEVFGEFTITRRELLVWFIPVSACTVGEVGLSNMAYSRLPISIMTILKSSAPVCIYTAAVLCGIERFNWPTCLACVLIAASIACAMPMSAYQSGISDDYMWGLIMIAIAMGCLAVRWTLVQKLTRRYSPQQLLYVIQPVSALILMPFAMIFDSAAVLGDVLHETTILYPTLLVLASSCSALILLLCEYKIVHDTTSLTLSVAGIGKEVVTLCLSMLVFSESFSLRQGAAVLVSIIGIFVYAKIRSSINVPDGCTPLGGPDVGTQLEEAADFEPPSDSPKSVVGSCSPRRVSMKQSYRSAFSDE